MEQSRKILNQRSVVFALIHGATYLPATWLLKNREIAPPLSIVMAIVPVVTFAIFIYTYIRAFTEMDEVRQRVQLEAVVIGLSLTVMLLMSLFLLSLSGISNPVWFGYGHLVGYCWLFYFIGWLISRKKYGA